MTNRKQSEIHPGSRVRVADPLLQGAERWREAQHGVVQKLKDGGLVVLLDGETRADFHLWTDVDIEAKPRPQLLDLPIVSIVPSRYQYRRRWNPQTMLELAESIRKHGVISRLIVVLDEDGGHELIAGERRLRAAWAVALAAERAEASLDTAVAAVCADDWWSRAAPWRESLSPAHVVPVELRPGSPADHRDIVLIENIQREDPTPVEEAEMFQVLLQEEGYTQATLAKQIGKSQGYISQRLGLLGLDDTVRQVVEQQGISFTAARAVATVPAAAQAAMVQHVQALQAKEGASDATSRKVQNLARQLREFLDAYRWEPPAGEILAPSERNYLRMMHRIIANLTPDQAARAVGLHNVKLAYSAQNYLGKQPLSIARDTRAIYNVLGDLTGKPGSVDNQWKQTAADAGWICQQCRWFSEPKPAHPAGSLCGRWNFHKPAELTTCVNYLDYGDPIVLPITASMWSAAKKKRGDAQVDIGIEVHDSAGVGNYVSHIEDYVLLTELAYQDESSRKTAEDQARRQAHIQPLWDYYKAQGPDTMFSLDLFQAHACLKCARYEPDNVKKTPALPPCHFAVQPLKRAQWSGDSTAAPETGVLVRRDGAIVPRCAGFRLASLPYLRGHNVSFPKAAHPSVLGWLASILKRGVMGHSHNNTLQSALGWLPYPRGNDDKSDIDRLCRYVRDSWQLLGGDGGIALLLDVALSESSAMGNYNEPISLLDPLIGKNEEWGSYDWDFAAGKPRNSWSCKAADWPEP